MFQRRSPVTALLILLIVAGTGFAQQNGRVVDLNLDFTPRAIAAGDVLGGPEPDIVTTTSNIAPLGELAIFVNQGPCNSPLIETVTVLPDSTRLLLADLNTDGHLDIVARAGPSVSILISQRPVSESFVRTDYMIGTALITLDVFAGDIDGDGDVDLGMGTFVLPNNGNGTFGTSYQLTQPMPLGVIGWTWGDFDGDGDMDLAGVTSEIVLGSLVQPVVRAWNSNGTSPVFTPWPSAGFNLPTLLGPCFDRPVTGDFNLDGRLDIIVGTRPSDEAPSVRRIFFGDAAQGFVDGGPGPSAESAEILRVGQAFDTDGDGQPEIIPAFRGPVILLGQPVPTVDLSGLESRPLNVTSTGLVPSDAAYSAIGGPYAVADFNTDGALDFAVTRPASAPNTLSIFYGGTGPLFELTLINGSLNETLNMSGSLSAPIVAELRNCFGNAAAGQLIQVSGLPLGASIVGPDPLVTDANGQISFSIQFDLSAPASEIFVFHELSNSIDLQYGVLPATSLTIVADTPGFATLDRPDSIQILATDNATRSPAAGIEVEVRAVSQVEILSSGADLITDSNGLVTIEFLPIAGVPGSIGVTTGGDPVTMVTSEFFIRSLRIITTPTTAIILYGHENAGIPLILAVDAPLPSPGYVSTVFGRVHTSVLNPQPSLTVLTNQDIPTLQTSLTLPVVPPPGLAGVDLVVQCYGVDGNYSFPNNVFISNPFFLTL